MPLICQYISPFVLNHRLCRGLFFNGLGQGRRHGASGPWRLQCLQQKLYCKVKLNCHIQKQPTTYLCETRGKVFRARSNLSQHMKTHKEKVVEKRKPMFKSFPCHKCKKIVQEKVEFKEALWYEAQESCPWSSSAVVGLHEQVLSKEASLFSLY